MRALIGPNNRFRLAPGALSDMDSHADYIQNEFHATPDKKKFVHRYPLKWIKWSRNKINLGNGKLITIRKVYNWFRLLKVILLIFKIIYIKTNILKSIFDLFALLIFFKFFL